MQISEKLIQMSARGDIAPMSSKDALAIEAALSAAEPQPAPSEAAKALIIGSYVNDAAHNLLVKHTGTEGGCPQVGWYKLRDEIALAIEEGIDAFADSPALSAQVQDVAGWQLVPVRPTEEMLDAYWGQTGESEAMRSRVQARAKMYYHVMLAAAPAKQEG